MSAWWRVVSLVGAIPKGKQKRDCDFVDRLSNSFTVVVCVVFTIVVSMHHYVGKPITCWAPKHITRGQTKYMNNYCWVRNTYYLPWEEEVPQAEIPHHKKQTLIYYQWIPFILLGQALFFYLPSVVWNGLNEKSGVDADNILATASTFVSNKGADAKERHLMFITRQMHRFLTAPMETQPGCSLDLKQLVLRLLSKLIGIQGGSYLCILYLIVKTMYLANVIAQLFVLNFILGVEFNKYGLEMARYLWEGDEWHTHSTVFFPRVTMCDFTVRRLGNLHSYTVQCVLPINLYNERIFFFLWYWMAFVAGATAVSFLKWLTRAVFESDRYRYVNRHLSDGARLPSEYSVALAKKFTKEYLRRDGVFLLRLVGHNTDRIAVTEIMCSLWDHWVETEGHTPNMADDTLHKPCDTRYTLAGMDGEAL